MAGDAVCESSGLTTSVDIDGSLHHLWRAKLWNWGRPRLAILRDENEPHKPSNDEALVRLEKTDARKAQLVKLRFFAGLTIEEAARSLRISTSTADNDWAYARCWLQSEIDGAAMGKLGLR